MTSGNLTNLPTPGNSAILLHPHDNVAVARVSLQPGQQLSVSGIPVRVVDPVPAGHKVAVRVIAAGDTVYRYGEAIGRARSEIGVGHHVHIHNVAYEEREKQYEFPAEERSIPEPQPGCPIFLGYPRPNGRAGTRNHIAVVAATDEVSSLVLLVAESFSPTELPSGIDGVVPFPLMDATIEGSGESARHLRRVLSGIVDHPNVAAAVVIGVGGQDEIIENLSCAAAVNDGRVRVLTLRGCGGTHATVEQARRAVVALAEHAATQRVELPASRLVLGLNCGGSDSFSGITANPALGRCCDWLAEYGGTFILGETPEIFGAEHLLVRRARSRAVAENLLSVIAYYRNYLTILETSSFDDNPSPGNKAGGLTNILEKALGASAKAGSSQLNEVVHYAERVNGPGFVFMNTPGNDPLSLAGIAAGGANVIVFTTGRGSAIGFPSIPVVKVATNSLTFRRMNDNMDINAGRIADGDATLDDVGREIFDRVLRVASGERTCAERIGHQEFVPWRIGAVV